MAMVSFSPQKKSESQGIDSNEKWAVLKIEFAPFLRFPI